jgi:hypothetical protein
MTLRSRVNRLERLAPGRGECRKPLVLGPPEVFPGERAEVESWCREQAASLCLVGSGCRDCPDLAMRRWSVVSIVAEE